MKQCGVCASYRKLSETGHTCKSYVLQLLRSLFQEVPQIEVVFDSLYAVFSVLAYGAPSSV
jgi:hypothetical protein